jgi:aspartyl-tRNA(Asn)/glutamyl-tRNA(Gln) amidotransferase subunit A
MSAAPDLRTITEIAPLVQSRKISPVDLVRACLAQMDARPELNAFITRLDDAALGEAREREREVESGRYRGALHGIPVAIKDLIDVAGTRTTSGSAIPSPVAVADAPSVARLRERGAIIIGKTNLHEFAFGTTSEESAFGPVRNPHDASRSAGGSSGGSAAALAAGLCFGALGTDTGGSIRIPSAACGTVGLKPTLGEIACDGVVPLSTSLDHLGPMTRSVRDAALLFEALKGAPLEPSGTTDRVTFGVPGPYFCGLPSIGRGTRSATPGTPCGTSRSRTRRGRRPSISTSCCPRRRSTMRRCWNALPNSIRRACACGSKWDATSSPRTTRERCACAGS